MTWRDIASCRDHPEPELWYPLGHKSRVDRFITEEAKAICRGCPVMEQCLADADDWGIRAAMTAEERRALKGRTTKAIPRSSAPHGTESGYKAHWRAGEVTCRECRDAMRRANWLRREREYARKGKVAPALNMRRLA